MAELEQRIQNTVDAGIVDESQATNVQDKVNDKVAQEIVDEQKQAMADQTGDFEQERRQAQTQPQAQPVEQPPLTPEQLAQTPGTKESAAMQRFRQLRAESDRAGGYEKLGRRGIRVNEVAI